MSLASPLTHLAELARAEAALQEHLRQRDASWAQQASTLPNWSRAHVAGHLVGNALGLVNLTEWARSGFETAMYPSAQERAAEIGRRAALPWDALNAEVAASAEVLGVALAGLVEPVAQRHLRLGSGSQVTVCDLAAVRIREI